jgi:zinc transport system permease protein
MIEPFTHPFMVRALMGGLLAAFLASYYGPFIVQRRLAFLGSGLGHAAFGGVALGILIDLQPLWIALPFTVGVALAIVWVQDRADLESDTTIGIFFAFSMALGVLFLSLKQGYTGDAFTYLFGSILAITNADLYMGGVVVLLTLCTCPWWTRWAYATFDRSLAEADLVPVKRDDYFLSACIAVSVVAAIKMVGIVLIAAFLVLPAATARLLAATFFRMTLYSLAVGMSTVFVGLLVSYYSDFPSGPVIILCQSALFFAIMLLRRKG